MNFTDKYRPQNAKQIIGKSQRTIAENLAKLTANDTIKPILLVGPSGVGKTSLAKMFVGLLEEAGHKVQLIHLSCAERSGVESARELVNDFKVGALFGDYKVYFLDEVHRLTKPAQEAFLIPLEEGLKPKVIVIGATTEQNTLLDTFISRFSVFYVNKPTYSEMETLCKWISVTEKFTLSDELKREVIVRSNGNVRNLVTLLEQVANNNYTSYNEQAEQAASVINLLRNKDMVGLLTYQSNDFNGVVIGLCHYVIKILQSNPQDDFAKNVLQIFGNGLNKQVPENVAWAYLVNQYLAQ
jgi:DNA polymerase-3 subunit gamma/tau